jgi:hypothetical protein
MKKSLQFSNAMLTFTLTSLLLSGCSTFGHINKDKKIIESAVAKNIDTIDALRNRDIRWKNITITNTIFAPPVESDEIRRPKWWFTKIENTNSNVPLGDALDAVLRGTGVNVSYNEGVQRFASFTFQGKTIGNVIESLSGASGYSYTIPAPNKLVWSLYETRTFHIAAAPGKEKFSQGQNQKVSEDSTVSSSDEYIKAEGEVDILDEVYQELLAHSSFKNVEKADSSAYSDDLTLPVFTDAADPTPKSTTAKKDKLEVKDIPIFVSKATSTITVKDTPEVLDEMQRIIDTKNRKLLTQVELQIDIIEVTLSEQAARTWDLAAVISNVGKYGFTFGSGSSVNSSNTMIGSASTDVPTSIISATATTGSITGSQAIAEVLRSVGSVSSRTMPSQLIRNNTIAKMRNFDNIAYILQRSVSTTANVGSESTIEQGNLEVGFSLYAMPSVFENNVSVRLATNLSSLISLDKNGDTDTTTDTSETSTKSYVESPHTTHKDFMSSFAAYNGDTVILTGLSRDSKQTKDSKGISEAISGSLSQSSSRTETLMLVTPRIIHPRI